MNEQIDFETEDLADLGYSVAPAGAAEPTNVVIIFRDVKTFIF